jgi:PHD/YefM family antitoxin component YafN of YafNO toxin-antitoxin module
MAGISDEQYIIDAKGNRKGVILSIERYEQMTEDLHDLAVVAERRNEQTTISLEEMKRRLKQDGIV